MTKSILVTFFIMVAAITPLFSAGNIWERQCGLGGSRLTLDDAASVFADESRRSWGLYRVSMWRLNELEEPERIHGLKEGFRNYGNACFNLMAMKSCRAESKSSEPLSIDVVDPYQKALTDLRGLLRLSDPAFLSALANDTEHKTYGLPKGHWMADSLLETGPFVAR